MTEAAPSRYCISIIDLPLVASGDGETSEISSEWQAELCRAKRRAASRPDIGPWHEARHW